MREAFAESARRACYGDVETAVFEDTALFVRGVGESSDVVRKEMYSFTDRGGRRDHAAPGVHRRACSARSLEHNLHRGALPVKVFTSGPAFRYERPQAGRYRQFYQFDLEAIGTEDPAVDAETIAVAWDAYRSLGLSQYTLLLNSLGDKNCRPVYRAALQDVPARARPRRRHPAADRDQPAARPRRQAPRGPRADRRTRRCMTDYLCAECKAHHDTVRALLIGLGIAFDRRAAPGPRPRLLHAGPPTSSTTRCSAPSRGIGGGGRYDGLSEDDRRPAAARDRLRGRP